MSGQSSVILYVDDDDDDQHFLSVALKELSPDTELIQVRNGFEALNFLSDTSAQHSALPDLIVLDLNMPVLDGRETFERIRRNPALQKIPTVILSSSSDPNDKALFNSQGAEFMSKPDDFSDLSEMASQMLGLCA